MAARDISHMPFVRALRKDGWTITHDPLAVTAEDTNLLIDIGVERVVAAERDEERIAVEIKSFVSLSAVQDLKEAVGQFWLYDLALRQSPYEADRGLSLAVRKTVCEEVFVEGIGKLFLNKNALRPIVFDPDEEEITKWIR